MRCLANFNKFLFQKKSNELINDLKKLFIIKIRLDVRLRKVDVTSHTRNGVTNKKLEAETLCRLQDHCRCGQNELVMHRIGKEKVTVLAL